MNHLTLYLITSTPLFVCLFWSLCLLVEHRRSSIDKKILTVFMINSTVMYLSDLMLNSSFMDVAVVGWMPFVDVLRTVSMLTCYPLFMLYILSLTGRLKRSCWFIFLPAMIQGGLLVVLYSLIPHDVLMALMQSVFFEAGDIPGESLCSILIIVYNVNVYLLFILVVVALITGFRGLRKYIGELELYYSDTSNKGVSSIRLLLLLFVVKSSKAVVGYVVSQFTILDSVAFTAVWMIINAVILFVFGFIGFKLSFNYSDVESEKTAGDDGVQSVVDNNGFKKELDRVVVGEELYLRSDLKISDIAERFNTNTTYIHGIISLSGEKNETFLSYINRHRLNHCLNLMQRFGDNKDVVDYAIESGFTSRSAFYRVFKKETGMTPTQYIGMHVEKTGD